MQKIGHSTPTANGAGEFTPGQPGSGIDATMIMAPWLNSVQRELVNVAESAGKALNPADDTQVLTAIRALVAAASDWSKIAGKPTTVSGYGIEDAFTKIETSAAIQKAVADLVASSPEALDTLNELATALGNDPNFAATMTAALAGKAAKATTLAGYGITDAVRTSDKASEEDAAAGTSTSKWMTPFTVWKAIKAAVTQATELATGIVRLSTQEEVINTASDSTAVTPKKLGFGLFVIPSSNGGIILPKWLGGFTVQWSYAAAVPQDSTLAVVFPFEFPTECFHVFANPVLSAITANTGPNYGATNITKSGCTIYNEGYAGAGTRFFAIGR